MAACRNTWGIIISHDATTWHFLKSCFLLFVIFYRWKIYWRPCFGYDYVHQFSCVWNGLGPATFRFQDTIMEGSPCTSNTITCRASIHRRRGSRGLLCYLLRWGDATSVASCLVYFWRRFPTTLRANVWMDFRSDVQLYSTLYCNAFPFWIPSILKIGDHTSDTRCHFVHNWPCTAGNRFFDSCKTYQVYILWKANYIVSVALMMMTTTMIMMMNYE